MAIETSLPNPNDPKTDIYRTATQERVAARSSAPQPDDSGRGRNRRHDRAAIPSAMARAITERFHWFRSQEVQSSQPPQIDTSIVSPEYFHVLGMTLLRGRLSSTRTLKLRPLSHHQPAAARTYWPGKDGRARPVGKRVHLLAVWPYQAGLTTIVGVIADARTESLADAGIPQIYLDIYQPPQVLAFYLRGQVDPAAISAQVRTQIQSVDAELPVFRGNLGRRSLLFAFCAAVLHGNGGAVCRHCPAPRSLESMEHLLPVNEQSREIAIASRWRAKAQYPQDVLRQGLTLAAPAPA